MKTKAVLICLLVIVSILFAGCGKPKDPENVAEMREKLAKAIKMAMWKVDATDEQQDRVDILLDNLAVDFFAYQQENHAIKRGLIATLAADSIDRTALQDYQKKGLDLFDRYTKRMLAAVMDISDILDKEQRRELVKLWREYEFDE